MADEVKVELPKFLDDFKGTKDEQVAAKAKFISEQGYEAFEKLVQNSRAGVRR